MSIKSASFKIALLSGLIMTGLVFDPAQADDQDMKAQTASEDAYLFDDEALDDELLPEDEDMDSAEDAAEDSGFEGLIYEPSDDEAGQPENIALMVETSDNAYTQMIYFPAGSTALTQPAEMIIAELASDLQSQENALVTVVANSPSLSTVDLSRISAISKALGNQGLPGSWVQVNRPVTLAAAY